MTVKHLHNKREEISVFVVIPPSFLRRRDAVLRATLTGVNHERTGRSSVCVERKRERERERERERKRYRQKSLSSAHLVLLSSGMKEVKR